jgi:hypothetical protein
LATTDTWATETENMKRDGGAEEDPHLNKSELFHIQQLFVED